MPEPNLKPLPCPFCGSTKLKVDQKTSSNTNSETRRCDKLVVVTVRCNKCHTRGPTVSMYAGWYDRPAQVLNNAAIEAWNQRIEKEVANDTICC